MKTYQQFTIQKTPQAFDETLMLFGLAKVLDMLSEGSITIEDKGHTYALSLSIPLTETAIREQVPALAPVHALATAKTKLPDTLRVDQYEDLRADVREYYDTPRENRADVPPHIDVWDVYRAINPASLPGYNSLMMDWHQARTDPETLLIMLDLFSQLPNDYDNALARWKALAKQHGWKIKRDATKQQIYNPDSGKGQNKSKSDGISIGNEKSFWLMEWLKAIGFFEGAITKQLRGVKDRKTFVLAPRKISYHMHQTILAKFRRSMSTETSVRFDIIASIRYVCALLEYMQDNSENEFLLSLGLGGEISHTVVAGFYTAFYKDMGNAIATMNLSFIALPAWIVVNDPADIPEYLSVLAFLLELTRQFDEGRSDNMTLLMHLRDFLSGDDLSAFFRFTNVFPAYLIGQRERNQYVVPLTTHFIERLLMSTEPTLSEILQDEGFQNIAYAIRQATVTAQYRKKQGDKKYDVRYGLGQELTRKARYPHDFIVALSDFLHKYNAENARVMETKSAPYRRSIRTDDIDNIVTLIDKYGSEVVASLLIAYGHARIPRDENLIEDTQGQE